MAAVNVIVLLLCALTRPTAARGPAGWFLSLGARPVYACAEIEPERGALGPHGGWVDMSPAGPVLVGRVYCDAPYTDDGRSLTCEGSATIPPVPSHDRLAAVTAGSAKKDTAWP